MTDGNLDPDLDRMIESGGRFLGIPLQSEWMPTIRLHLHTSLAAGRLAAGLQLPDETEPAPVFTA
jgi:hypothetical protein